MIQKNKIVILRSRKSWTVAILLSIVALYSISLFTPLLSGYAWFPIANIRCGEQPYIASNFSASNTYTTPGDELYRGPNPFTTPDEYYCSREQAEKAHYRPYEWGERCRVNNSTGQTFCASAGSSGYMAMIPYIVFLIVGGVAIAFTALKFPFKKIKSWIKKLLQKNQR